jgi:hypothetical protein
VLGLFEHPKVVRKATGCCNRAMTRAAAAPDRSKVLIFGRVRRHTFQHCRAGHMQDFFHTVLNALKGRLKKYWFCT